MIHQHCIVYCIHYKLTCFLFVTVKLNFLQLKAFNYYKKNCMSIEVVKEDELQKVNFRVKSKVRQNESKKDSKDQESLNQVPHLSQNTKWEI